MSSRCAVGVFLAIAGLTVSEATLASQVTFAVVTENEQAAASARLKIIGPKRLYLRADEVGKVTADLPSGLYRVDILHDGRKMTFKRIKIKDTEQPLLLRLRVAW